MEVAIQARGALKKELVAYLRSPRIMRRSRFSSLHSKGRGQIQEAISIRAHHRKVKRIALSTDGKLTSLIPQVAGHFIEAEVKSFGYDDLESAIARTRSLQLREALRILPDTMRLVASFARDKTLSPGVRRRVWFLMVYLAMPIDLIPDFIPVLGQADDAILIVLILRSVMRIAGLDVVREHWRGSDDGFAAFSRLTGIAAP